jgi:hypothetical protein
MKIGIKHIIEHSIRDAIMDNVRMTIWESVNNSAKDTIRSSVRKSIWISVKPICMRVFDFVEIGVSKKLQGLNKNFVLRLRSNEDKKIYE